MEKLNDDCLIEIFKYLPIMDRLRAEAVSRKWQSLIKKSWSSFKYFSFRNVKIWYLLKSYENSKKVFNEEAFKNLLMRFGTYLISIDLSFKCSFYQDVLTLKSIRCIKQFCPKLRALNLGHIFDNFHDDSDRLSTEHCECEPRLAKIIQTLQNWKIISNLKEFQVKVGHAELNSLSVLISKMNKLESLHIEFEGYPDRPTMTITGLPFSTLNELILESCWAIEEEILIEIVKSIKNLRTLVLTELRSYSVFHHLLPSRCKSLKNLRISGLVHCQIHLNRDVRIAQSFVNLKKLSLKANYLLITDEFLRIMAYHCRELIFLDISYNRKVTDDGMQHVVSLPKLQCLFIDYLDEIIGKTLMKMDNLEVLSCFYCVNIEDKGLCSIINQSKLRGLDITGCKKITNKFLDATIRELNTRKEEMDLILLLDCTQISLNNDESIPPLLRIVQNMFSKDFDKLYVQLPEKHLFES